MKSVRPLFLIVVFILGVGLACSLAGGGTPSGNSSGGGGKSTSAPSSTSAPAATNAGQSSSTGLITSISDAEKAVIQIEADGAFIDSQTGAQVNGWERGSGFFIDPSGIAVTNNHVVTGAAALKVWVEGVQHTAQILGVSECSDLAVIKVDGGPYPYLKWYNDPVKTGLEVYPAGYPLGEPQFSLTKGIISKEKADGQTSWASLDYVLGQDATINPGNSGGPLLTSDASVVGINYSSLKSANQYFAIDAKTAEPVVAVLQTGKDVDTIGINGTAYVATNGYSGIWINSIKSGSPADKAGLKPGDILHKMENLTLATDGTMKDYCSILRSHKPGDTLAISIARLSTNENLDGELNGRELAVTSQIASSGGSTGGTSGGSTGGTTGGTTGGGDVTATPDPYFTETFNGDLSNYLWWEFHVKYGTAADDKSVAPYTSDNALVFDLKKQTQYVYVIYQPYDYSDVRLDMVAENRGSNSNSVSLICRYSNEGWYEANVQNDGLYEIDAYVAADGRYYRIYNGGSNLIKQGKDTNSYTFICSGNDLTLGMNGTEVKTVTEKKYNLPKGQVGLGVSSFNAIPVLVNVSQFQISQP